MFRLKLIRLINEFGIKKEYLISLIGSNRVTFSKKLKGEIEFSDFEKSLIINKYFKLL